MKKHLEFHLLLYACCVLPASAAVPLPNIIVILADDMGYSDIGCFGGEIETPNLDSLARNGLRCSQFYNMARCCPTRASLLTGLYPHQAGVGHMMDDRGFDGYRGDLNQNCVTIAEALRPAGYRNYAVGKWHVTRHAGPDGPKHNWPLQRGFDRYYGTIHGAGSYFDPSSLTRDNTQISAFADPDYKPKTYYYTDAITDQAARFLVDHQAQHGAQPFFLYVAYTAAHWPMHALPEDIAKYRGKFDSGYGPNQAARLQRLRELGLLDSQWDPAKLVGDWDSVRDKRWEAAGKEVYAAMVDRMDQGIGRIVQNLKQNGQFENTLIFFLQDNGGCAEGMGRTGTKEHPEEVRQETAGLPPMEPGALQTAGSVPRQTRDGFPVLMGKRVFPGPADTYIAYGEAWANVSNTPFREYKHWVHEGGISTPLIVHWPLGVRKDAIGKIVKDPGHLIDIMATCVDVAGVEYPRAVAGKPIPDLRGVSLRPLFAGQPLPRANPIFWEHEGNRAVRDGKWKLVAKENEPWELYDMEKDRTEAHDLAATEPDRVKEMASKWNSWAAQSNVLPLGGWRAQRTNGVTRLELHQGDHLAGNQALGIANRGFTITARIEGREPSGVIVAQGGATHGYTLFTLAGRVSFAIRRAGTLTSITGEKVVTGVATIDARLDENGQMNLLINGESAATAKAPGAIPGMPSDGLDVGADRGAAVGPYQTPNPFSGKIASVIVEVK